MTLVDSTPTHAGPPVHMPTGPRLTLRTAYRHGVYVVAPYGELDLATAPDLQRAMDRAEASDAREIVLDLSHLSFLDSTGLRLVIHADARSRSDGNRLRLLRGSESVQRLFVLCGLADRLPWVG